MEAQDIEGSQVDYLCEQGSEVGVQAEGFDHHLGSVELLLGAVFLVHKDGQNGPRTSVVHRGKGDEREPDIGEDSGNVGDISIVGGNVTSAVGLL